MIRLFLLIAALLIASPLSARADVYRNFIWGNTMEDVREFETGMFFDEQGESLFYITMQGKQRLLIRYDFSQNSLHYIKVEHVNPHNPDPKKVMDLLMDVQQSLTNKFGKPSEEEMVWVDPEYRNHPQFLSTAFASGHIIFRTKWDVPGTRILLTCFRKNFKYQLFYEFEDKRGIRQGANDKTFNFNLQP